MQRLPHLFIVFHIAPSQSFPPTAEQQTTLYKVTATVASECMNKLRERSLLMLNFPLVQIVVSLFFSFFSITVDNDEAHPSFLQSIRTESFWENNITFPCSTWICTPLISLSTTIWVEMI